jgi:O-antigen/teichoic acid export membrane protein
MATRRGGRLDSRRPDELRERVPHGYPLLSSGPGSALTNAFRIGQVGRHGLVYAAGVVLNRAVSLVMLPIYTRYLTPADYGVLQLVELSLDLIAILFGSHLGAGIFRLYQKTDVPAERAAVVSTAFGVVTVAYAAAGSAAYIAAPWISELVFGSEARADLVRLASMTLGVQGLVLVPLSYLQLLKRPDAYVGANAAKLLIQLAMNIALVVVAGMGPHGVLIGNLVANVVLAAALSTVLLRSAGARMSADVTRALLRFGLPFIATQIAAFVVTHGDRFFLQRLYGETSVGIYALAYQFAVLLARMGYAPFSAAWEPIRFEVASRADRDEIYSRTFLYLNVYLCTLGLGITLFAGDLLRVIADPAFHPAGALVPLITLAYVFYGWSGFLNLGILMRERTELVTAATWVGGAVALAGYVALIPPLGTTGAALATVAAYAVRAGAVYALAQRTWAVRYDWAPVLRLLLIAGVAGALGAVASRAPLWGSIGLHVALFAGFVAGAWRLGVLSPADRAALRRSVRSPASAVAVILGRS